MSFLIILRPFSGLKLFPRKLVVKNHLGLLETYIVEDLTELHHYTKISYRGLFLAVFSEDQILRRKYDAIVLKYRRAFREFIRERFCGLSYVLINYGDFDYLLLYFYPVELNNYDVAVGQFIKKLGLDDIVKIEKYIVLPDVKDGYTFSYIVEQKVGDLLFVGDVLKRLDGEDKELEEIPKCLADVMYRISVFGMYNDKEKKLIDSFLKTGKISCEQLMRAGICPKRCLFYR